MKKNSFFTFCLALIPGAGQMYLGMMKRGVSLMLAFTMISVLSGFLNLPILMVFLPVLWFYSFFDTFNNKALLPEQRIAQDMFLFQLDEALAKDWVAVIKRRHVLFGSGCIFLGIYLLYNNLLRPLLWQMSVYYPWLDNLLRAVPSLIVSIAVIALGLHLVFGNRKGQPTPPVEEDFVEYGGTHNE